MHHTKLNTNCNYLKVCIFTYGKNAGSFSHFEIMQTALCGSKSGLAFFGVCGFGCTHFLF